MHEKLNKKPLHERAEPHGIHSVTKEGVRELVKKARELEYSEQGKALREIFGPLIDLLQQPKPEAGATNLFLPLLSDIFDKGSSREINCMVPYGGKEIALHEKAAPIYTRSSFIAKICETEPQINNAFLSMGRIDLKGLREADFDVGDIQDIRPADIIINTTIHTIRSVLTEVWEEEKLANANSYELGRYGGDELVIAFIGEEAQKRKEHIMQTIEERLAEKRGYYKNTSTGVVERRAIEFKRDDQGKSVEWISFPHEVNERIMYGEYLNRGIILSHSDFEREKKKYSVSGVFDFASYRNNYPETSTNIPYPSEVNTREEKIAYLTEKYPEFTIYFGLAHLFDVEDETGTHIKRQDALLKIIETSIFDRLLGEMIYSRYHFTKHMRRDEFEELQVIDFKYLKEINTAMTYADADNTIKALWNEIKESIPENERSSIVISRFAGAFYIGVRKGCKLSDKCRSKLSAITTFSFKGGEEYSVPLGHASIQLENESDKRPPSSKIFDNLEEASNQRYYTALVKDILYEQDKNSEFIVQMMGVDLKELSNRPYQPLSKIELYALALRGKRGVVRVEKLIAITDKDSEITGNAQYASLRAKLIKKSQRSSY